MEKTKTILEAKTVTISLKKGIVCMDPANVRVKREQDIIWSCDDTSLFYAIHLGDTSPFDDVHHQAGPGTTISVKIPDNAQINSYKYVIAVSNGTKVWIADPTIIIRE